MESEDNDTMVEDATVRLVRSLVGSADNDAIRTSLLLAGTMLEGSLGMGSNERDMSATWRRIDRSATGREMLHDLHARLKKVCQHEQTQPSDMADWIMMVLSQLMDQASNTSGTRGRTDISQVPSRRENQSRQNRKTQNMEQEYLYEKKQVLSAMQEEETTLLRECLYALQGLEGEHIRFFEQDGNRDNVALYRGFRIRPSGLFSVKAPDLVCESRLGSGALDALQICGDAGWLHKRVKSFVNRFNTADSTREGVVSRALAVALSNELRDYHALVANFESKLQESPLRFTLRQLLVDMRMPTVRLKTLAMLTDGLSEYSGGQLLSALHKHTAHGDTRHQTLVQSMVHDASQPWFHMLYLWTMTGSLVDPHNEFFIVERPNVNDQHMWHDRYQINRQQVPIGILERDLVRPTLIVGKGINFIRSCLLDTEWTLVLHDDKESSTTNDSIDLSSEEEIKTRLGYHYTPAMMRRRACPDGYYVSPLHRTLAHAAHQVHAHILHSLQEQHHLIQHLWALKQSFFLGQGDFITALMDGLHQEFVSRDGIIGIYTHSLMAIMEGALRSTNAAALPSYTLERLGVELLLDENDDARYKFGPGRSQGDTETGCDEEEEDEAVDIRSGWDIFMLTYDIPAPLSAIVHPKAMAMYKLEFKLLFRLKRVEYMLNATWRQSTALQHALFTYAQHIRINLSTNSRYARATLLLRKISLARQSMLHFVGNLQSYLMIEVLEGGWKDLATTIKAAQTLDEVIESHDCYLDNIVRKSLLRGAIGLLATKRDLRDQGLATQLEFLLDLARTFCTLQERIFTDALQEVQKAAEKQQEAERRLEEGEWGFDAEDEEEQNFYGLTDESIIHKVVLVSEDFDETIVKVLSGLDETVNGNGHDDDPFVSPISTPTSGTTASNEASRPGRATEQLDMDSLRFLTFQLDYSDYYSSRGNAEHGQ